MELKFKFNKPTVFELNDSLISITPGIENPISVKKNGNGIKEFSSLETADMYVTDSNRDIDDIINSWVNKYSGEPLKDYLKLAETKHEDSNDLGKAFNIILNELTKPKELHIDALNRIDNKVGKLLDIAQTKENKVKRNKHTWNIPEMTDKKFEEQVYGYNLETLTRKLETKKALLLTGVPGTGKTKMLISLIKKLTNSDEAKYRIISFGQDTDYTDFIGGVTSVDGEWKYRDGVLTEMCKLADSDRNNKYYLGIDELSRGNTEAIFGELMTGIEHRDTLITLKNGDGLVIPSNLYIIGTMNILDNSTKKLDTATMERFTRENILPQWNKGYINWLVRGKSAEHGVIELLEKVSTIMTSINKLIAEDELLREDKVIGVRAISGIELTNDKVRDAIKNQIIPDIKKRTRLGKESSNYSNYIRDLEEAIK